ncbi:Adenine nucleotide alpha hydrolases-like superfamily protein isoform 2 [Hibiscus syriacus]|uniref:Adenine nucleotide alpha hydrolases-like superfamily protein isoform 2 n=1 Tax=Hibiscus syriacus TaxID=106335 RepID=A0A6A3C0S0_HIBSY|nr:Adenine nucleotide alpha hydrolases-like superfamily protein isoform 2 [Hibiscus syriacus]
MYVSNKREQIAIRHQCSIPNSGLPCDESLSSSGSTASFNSIDPGPQLQLRSVASPSLADWGSITPNSKNKHEDAKATEEEFDILATARANKLAQPLVDAKVPFKIHIVKDRDMKERLCLEVERLGLSAVIMGSRGTRRSNNGRLGSVSYHCVNHCICPVVVVRFPDKDEIGAGRAKRIKKKKIVEEDVEMQPVPEEELEYHDADSFYV